jgi:hypothetical protein
MILAVKNDECHKKLGRRKSRRETQNRPCLSYLSVEDRDLESKLSSHDIEKEGKVQQLRWETF